MQQLEQGMELCGRFVLAEKLGTGGHGEVWRALDTLRAEDVALKVVYPQIAQSPEAWEALQREYLITQRLSHRGILEVYEPMRDAASTILPMTLAAGDLRRLRGEPYTRIVPVLMEIAAALAHAHERGVVHRDLKPSNVLVDGEGHIKVSDFGVATLDNQAPAGAPGSPFSVSPQQLAGEPAAASDDIYGLGALAYELLSGYPPFYPNFEANAVMNEPAPELVPIHAVPPRLSALIMRMLLKAPASRPASMTAVDEELQACLFDTLGVGNDVLVTSETVARPIEFSALAPEPPRLDPIDEHANDTQRLPQDWHSKHGLAEDGKRPSLAGRAAWMVGGTALVALLVAVFFLLPRYAQQRAEKLALLQSTPTAPAAAPVAAEPIAANEFPATRERFERMLGALETRGAGVWGGAAFAAAKTLGVDANAAAAAGQNELALDRITTAVRRLERVEAQADAALTTQLAAGETALAAGQTAAARQVFELASRINPADTRVRAALQRAGGLEAALPALANAETALAAGDTARAAQLFSTVLVADPQNARAREGLAKARATGGEDRYARALGEAQTALRDGRLSDAREAFDRARALRPQAPEVQAGLQQLATVRVGEDAATQRMQIESLEAQERWADARTAYEALLAADPSLQYARAGRSRTLPRAELAAALQYLIDKPERLTGGEVRSEADSLLRRARAVASGGPVLRSQIARLELLLPDFDKPVPVVLESDGLTEIAVRRVGLLGSFARHELQLKPGRYAIVGTRSGFRDVRRELMVAPGQAPPVLQIRCIEPI